MAPIIPFERPLGAGTTHLWLCHSDQIIDDNLLSLYHRIIDEKERARTSAFKRANDGRQYLIGRAALRWLISQYIGCSPCHVRFRYMRHGRPELWGDSSGNRLRFNLAHTDGLIVCAFTQNCDIGVDAEIVEPRRPVEAIAQHCFSERELRHLMAMPPNRRTARFFDLWVLKEAYAKARGLGLSMALDAVDFSLGDDKDCKIQFEAPQDPEASFWRFWLLRSGNRHRVAIACKGKPRSMLQLEVRQFVPFLFDQPSSCSVLAKSQALPSLAC